MAKALSKSQVAGAIAEKAGISKKQATEILAIIAEIEPGAAAGGGSYVIEPDRRAAIRLALGLARAVGGYLSDEQLRQAGVEPQAILLEPAARNTGPAIA